MYIELLPYTCTNKSLHPKVTPPPKKNSSAKTWEKMQGLPIANLSQVKKKSDLGYQSFLVKHCLKVE